MMARATRAPDLSLTHKYEELLRGSAATSEEAALQAAYDFGRELLGLGLGVLDLATIHRRALVRLLKEQPPEKAARFVDDAARVFVESLVPFEMTHRGFRETHVALRSSEERYRELFENANDVVFTTDLDFNLTSINRAGEVLGGYSREEMLALKSLESLIPPEYLELVRAMRSQKLANPDGRTQYELEIEARDGRRIPLEVSTRLIWADNKPVGVQGIARDVTDRKQAELTLRDLNQRLEGEAKRIAHALHDEAGQLLASVYLCVADIARDLPAPHARRIEALRALLDQVDGQLRRLAHELRPAILDDLGLLPACQFLAQGVSGRTKTRVEVRGRTGGRLPPDVETALYRVAQEALNNATKHARATRVTLEFNRSAAGLSGTIRDDGVGFDAPSQLVRNHKHGMGLKGMRERLTAVGGRLSITSTPGSGTSIEFEVPLEN
jgi:PAS domain S-box-containing protein